MSVIQDSGTLTIKLDQQANTVEIKDDGTASGLTVTVDGLDQTFSGAAIDKFVLYTRGGWDNVSYTLTQDYTAGTAREVEVFLGNGNDTFTADLGHAIVDSSSLKLTVNGGNGKDDLSVTGIGSVAGTST